MQWGVAWRYRHAAIVGLIGVALSGLGFVWAERQHAAIEKLQFDRLADAQIGRVTRELEAIEGVVTQLAAYLGTSDVGTRERFARFAQTEIERYPSLQALEWIPRVPHAESSSYEQRARQDGLAGFSITERVEQGRMAPARERDEYFPVYFVEPLRTNKIAVGYDLASNPIRLAGLRRARDSGESVATGRITLVQEPGGQHGFLIYRPVYRAGVALATAEARRANLLGFALGVFRIGDFVDQALSVSRTARRVHPIQFHLFDLSAPEGARRLFPHDAPEAMARGAMQLEKSVPFAGRTWLIVAAAAPGAAVATGTPASYVVFALGLALTVTLVVLVAGIVRKTAEREAEARQVASRLSAAIEGSREGLCLFDADDRLAYCNRRYIELSPTIADLIVPGARLEDLARGIAERFGEARAGVDPEEWFRRRMAYHRAPEGTFELLRGTARIEMREERTEDGETLVIIEDVTGRKRLEETLAAESALRAGVLENLDQGVSVFDADMRLIAWNERYVELMGLPRGLVREGTPFAEIIKLVASRGVFGDVDAAAFAGERIEQHRDRTIAPAELFHVGDMLLEARRAWLGDGSCVTSFTDITARLAGHAEAARGELRALTQASGDLLLRLLADGAIREYHGAPAVVAGYIGEGTDLAGEPLATLFAEDQAQRIAGALDGLKAGGQQTLDDLRLASAGGATVTLRLLPLPGGEALAQLHGPTEMERTAPTTGLTADLLSDAVLAVDRTAAITEVNAAAAVLLGYTRDELIGRSIGTVFVGEGEGEGEGALVAHVLSMTDADLQSRHDRDPATFRAGVEAAPVALLTVAPGGAIEHANAAAARLLGWSRDELAGLGIEALVPQAQRDAHSRQRAGFAAAPSARRMGAGRLLRVLRRDGAVVEVEIGLFPLRTEQGDRVVAAVRHPALSDWAAFRRTPFGRLFVEEEEEEEEEFWAVERALAARDGRRVPVLASGRVLRDGDGSRAIAGAVLTLRDMTAHARLQTASARLGRLEAVDELAGGVSHEFGNRLGAVKNFLVALRRDLDADKPATPENKARWRTTIENAERSVMDSAALARSLVTFARRQRLAPTMNDVNAALTAIRVVLVQSVGDAVALELDLAEELLPVEIDRSGFDGALLNLALNARDAMPGSGTLRIATGRTTIGERRSERWGIAPGDYATVTVSDTGAGMTADVMSRAFDPFFTTKEVGQGTGMGLPMVRGFAEASGGFVELDGAPGQGTTVTLYLPLAAPGEELSGRGDTDARPEGPE